MGKVDKKIFAKNSSWTFNNIANKFESHVEKSVPFYHEGHELINGFSDFFIKDNSLVYDIGCSTGLLIKKLSKHHSKKKLKIIGIDSVSSMIKKAKKANNKDKRSSFLVKDIEKFKFKKSSLITSYYTIQFIHPHIRQKIVDKIYSSLHWGAAFILFEKVRGSDARFNDYMTQLYYDFKFKNGFSEEEILNKSKSLKGILEPFSTKGNYDLLKRAGFKDIMTIFRWNNFEGIIAIK
jgi:tRNA (cmo5U34)-methyltransferase